MKTIPLVFSNLVLQCLLVCCGIGMIPVAQAEDAIRLRTTLGDIFVTLTPEAAPQTVTNFLDYLTNGDFEDSFFHESQPGGEGIPQTIAAGRFRWPADSATGLSEVRNGQPIPNEFNQSNRRGTIAMVVPPGAPEWFRNSV